jgi:hypothetical protein
MTEPSVVNALLYEVALWVKARCPWIVISTLCDQIIANCRPDWVKWRTETTIERVEQQAAEIVVQWKEEEKNEKANTLAAQATKLYPTAKITPLPNAVVPSVMIEQEAPEDASDDVKALGGEMRITYQFEELQ